MLKQPMSCGLENSVIIFFNLVPTLVAGARPSLFWESGNLFNPGSISLANYTLFIKKKKKMLRTTPVLPVPQGCS